MRLITEDLPPRVLSAANFAVLESILLRFHPPELHGSIHLVQTPLLRHLRLEFRPENHGEAPAVRGHFFHEDLLCETKNISRLIEEAASFLSLIRPDPQRPEVRRVVPISSSQAAVV